MLFFTPLLHKLSPSKCNYEHELLHAPRYILNLQYISSSSKSDDKDQSYARKTNLHATKSFNPRGEPDTPPTDNTLRSMAALRVTYSYIILILRGSAAPEPKNTKIHEQNRPLNLKFFIFRAPRKPVIFQTFPSQVEPFKPIARSSASACA